MLPRRSRQVFISVAFGLIATIVAGCAAGGFHPEDGVKADAGMSSGAAARDEQMAQASAQQFEAKTPMWNDPLLETYLTEITQRIVAVAKPRPFRYRIRVVRDPSVNAFTPGGGLVYVHAGLLARLENEAQLAMILAHEIAHVTEGHVLKGSQTAHGIQLLAQVAALAGSATGVLKGEALQTVYGYVVHAAVNGHGRSLESEADAVGLDYLIKAGYDPREAPRTFELLLKEYGDPAPIQHFFYNDHPTNVARIERTSQLVKTQYADQLAHRHLIVNTEEFQRRTREVVIAVGRLDYAQKRFNTAAAMFEKALRVAADDPVPSYYLAKIALETSSGTDAVDRAMAYLLNAIRADATYAPAYRELGLAHYRKGDRPKAIAALERYLALDPRAKDAHRINTAIQELKRY
jgi:beta-barrel assembly-enhancing protease